MTPYHHPACNDTLRGFPILRGIRGLTSFWIPSEAELAALNSGSAVMLTFPVYMPPPVNVQVTKPEDPAHSEPSPPDDLLQLAKDLVSHANREAKGHPETAKLTDRLLDMIPTVKPPDLSPDDLRRLHEVIRLLMKQGPN